MFDPDEVARANSEGHLVPPGVRRLSPEERQHLVAWADRKVKARELRWRSEFSIRDYATESDPLLVAATAARSVDLIHRFIEANPTVDGSQRLALWGKLLEAHLLLDRLQVLMLGMEIEVAQNKTSERRNRQVAGGIDP